MKRFLLLLVTLVFAVAFAACKDKTNNTTQPTPTGAASTPTDAVTPTDTVTPTPTEAPTEESTQITDESEPESNSAYAGRSIASDLLILYIILGAMAVILIIMIILIVILIKAKKKDHNNITP